LVPRGGIMKDYELVVLYHPDLEIDLDNALKKVEEIINGLKGKITFSENWGKRKLAYVIKKQEYAIYVYYEIQLPDGGIEALESQFNITDEVIRYLVTKPTPNFGDREKKMIGEQEESENNGGEEEKPEKAKADKDEKKKKDEKKEEVKKVSSKDDKEKK